MAILPFTPVQGNIYTLSASMNPIGVPDPSDWFVLGFTGRNATDNWLGGAQNSASIFARVSNNEYPDFYAQGPGTGGIGNLVDADLASESARLQSLQVKQQLGTQALSIANQAPQTILSLFRN
jgi:hypothetical protein